MIYTEITIRAMQLAYEAHHSQLDKGGMPYILHPVHVAEQMTDENTTAAALLHDVMEDCAEEYALRIRKEFPPAIAEAVEILTKRDDVSYGDYICGILKNPIARRIKIADLKHNMDYTRVGATAETLTEDQRARLQKYRASLEILMRPEEQP